MVAHPTDDSIAHDESPYFTRGRPGYRKDPKPPGVDWGQTAINFSVWVIVPGLFWFSVIRAIMPTVR